MASLLSLNGCSYVPDTVNPMEWYKGAYGWWQGSDTPPNAQAKGEAPGADKPFPSLSSVPAKPTVMSSKDRGKLEKGLVADRDNAHYSDEPIQRQAPDTSRPAASRPSASRSAVPVQTASTSPAPAPAAPPSRAAPAPAPAPAAPAPAAAQPRSTVEAVPPKYPPVQAETLPDAPPPSGSVAARPTEVASLPSASSSSMDSAPAPASAYAGSSADPDETMIVSSAGVTTTRNWSGMPLGGGRWSGGNAYHALTEITPSRNSAPVAVIQFGNASSTLGTEDRGVLTQVARLFRQQGGRLRIVGHSSSRTGDMDFSRHDHINSKMSEKRAVTVASALRTYGVSPDSMYVGGVADSSPLYPEVMPTGEAGNRRTEIFIDY